MDPLLANTFYAAGILLIGLGVAGTVLPFLPGPLLIWCGALVWAWGNGFERVGWLELAVLGVLAALAWASDLWLTTLFSRRTGVSWRAILGSVVCGIAGGILLSSLPVIGTLFGALIGAALGMFVIEYWLKRNARAALEAVRAYVVGSLVSSIFEIVVALLMVGIFVWQAWLA
jgi:hypothetical protein